MRLLTSLSDSSSALKRRIERERRRSIARTQTGHITNYETSSKKALAVRTVLPERVSAPKSRQQGIS
ncbi:hypothetical protein [Methylocystis sp.]|jgi:hypothetical protein|uniref:hypothetical protein n=1 Tax=Methylocystis sp. TaxID=1911079 RepID=UPI003D13392C